MKPNSIFEIELKKNCEKALKLFISAEHEEKKEKTIRELQSQFKAFHSFESEIWRYHVWEICSDEKCNLSSRAAYGQNSWINQYRFGLLEKYYFLCISTTISPHNISPSSGGSWSELKFWRSFGRNYDGKVGRININVFSASRLQSSRAHINRLRTR